MIRINLVQTTSTRKKSALPTKLRPEIAIGLLAGLAVVGILLWYWFLTQQAGTLEDRKAELEQQSIQLAAIRAQLTSYEQLKAQLEERTRVIEDLKATQKGPVQMLNAIIASVPEEPRLWLTRLTQEDAHVTIQGQAFDVPAIADFVSSLGNHEPFEEVDLDYWEEGPQSVAFELSCTLPNR